MSSSVKRSPPVKLSPLNRRLSTRVTEDDWMAVFHASRRRGSTEEQMVRFIIRRYVDANPREVAP
jgi:hypothetical protein